MRLPDFHPIGGQIKWARINFATEVSSGHIQDGTGHSGEGLLRVETTVMGGSIGTDFVVPSGVLSVGAFAWVRAALPGQTVNAALAIWNFFDDETKNLSSAYRFTVGHNWTFITNALNLSLDSRNVRIEFYIDTVNTPFDIDSVIAV